MARLNPIFPPPTINIFFETEGEAVCLSASGTGATECSVVNLIKKDDKVIIPVNGEFSTRLAQQIEWAGGQAIKIETEPGVNATYDQVKEAFFTTYLALNLLLS